MVLKFCFTLFLECDDNQSHEDVHKEEWEDNDEYDVVNSHSWSIVWYGTLVLLCYLHRVDEDTKIIEEIHSVLIVV